MPTYRTTIQYIVSLNKSRKTSVNIHKSRINNRPDIPDWEITPNLISRTGFSPSELDPPVNALMHFQLVLEQGNPWASLQRFYLLTEDSNYVSLEPSKIVYDQHYGMFSQLDFQGTVIKFFSASTREDAKIGLLALYGPNSVKSELIQVNNILRQEDNSILLLESDYAFILE